MPVSLFRKAGTTDVLGADYTAPHGVLPTTGAYKLIQRAMTNHVVAQAFERILRVVGTSATYHGHAYFNANYQSTDSRDGLSSTIRSMLMYRMMYGMVPMRGHITGDHRGFRIIIPSPNEGSFVRLVKEGGVDSGRQQYGWMETNADSTDTNYYVYVWNQPMTDFTARPFVSPVGSLLDIISLTNSAIADVAYGNYVGVHTHMVTRTNIAEEFRDPSANDIQDNDAMAPRAGAALRVLESQNQVVEAKLMQLEASRDAPDAIWVGDTPDPLSHLRSGFAYMEAQRRMFHIKLRDAQEVRQAPPPVMLMELERLFNVLRLSAAAAFGINDVSNVRADTAAYVNAARGSESDTAAALRADILAAIEFFERSYLQVMEDTLPARITDFKSFKRYATELRADIALDHTHEMAKLDDEEFKLVSKILEGAREKGETRYTNEFVVALLRFVQQDISKRMTDVMGEVGTGGSSMPYHGVSLPKRRGLKPVFDRPILSGQHDMPTVVEQLFLPVTSREHFEARLLATKAQLRAAGMNKKEIELLLQVPDGAVASLIVSPAEQAKAAIEKATAASASKPGAPAPAKPAVKRPDSPAASASSSSAQKRVRKSLKE